MTEIIQPMFISNEDRNILKKYCHINHTYDDVLLDRLLLCAQTLLEVRYDCVLLKRNIIKELYTAPVPACFDVSYKKVNSISTMRIMYQNSDTAIHDIDRYARIDANKKNVIHLFNIDELFVKRDDFISVQCVFNVGLADTIQGLSEDLKQALLMLSGYYYDNRGHDSSQTQGIPQAVSSLMQPYKEYRLYD